MFRFKIRDLLWLTMVVALGSGWWLDHYQISGEEREAVKVWRKEDKTSELRHEIERQSKQATQK